LFNENVGKKQNGRQLAPFFCVGNTVGTLISRLSDRNYTICDPSSYKAIHNCQVTETGFLHLHGYRFVAETVKCQLSNCQTVICQSVNCRNDAP